MRQDMKKVLTERPRYGHGNGYGQVRARETRLDDDDLTTHQGIRRPYNHYGNRKSFSDLLGPLRRFLWSCRGRPWNAVWSEICGQISNNTTGAHLKDHVLQDVAVHCVLRDGQVFELSPYLGLLRVNGLYVHPSTGILCGDPPTRRAWKRTNTNLRFLDGAAYCEGDDGVLRPATNHHKAARYSRKIIGREQEGVYVNGVWYWVVFATVPAPSWLTDPRGKLPPRLVHHARTDFVTGSEVKEGSYRFSKRQMSATDLRRHGLINHDSHNNEGSSEVAKTSPS